jgi:hypothetical protein
VERGGYEYQHLCHPLRPTARCWLLLRGSGNLAGRSNASIVLTRPRRPPRRRGQMFSEPESVATTKYGWIYIKQTHYYCT